MIRTQEPATQTGEFEMHEERSAPWYRRTYRWGQTNLTEIDPSRYDGEWWREQWRRTRVQGVVVNAGGIVATPATIACTTRPSSRARKLISPYSPRNSARRCWLGWTQPGIRPVLPGTPRLVHSRYQRQSLHIWALLRLMHSRALLR